MKSGLYYPNRFVLLSLQALRDVVGVTGMDTIYSHSNLEHLSVALPSDNMEKEFDFSDFSALFETIENIFGERGAHTLALRAGRITFKEGMSFFGKLATPGSSPGTSPLGPNTVIIRLNRLANFFNSVSDQKCSAEATTDPNTHLFKIQVCPVCMDRSSLSTVCSFFEGLLSEASKAFSGGLEYECTETECMAFGSDSCIFEIRLASS